MPSALEKLGKKIADLSNEQSEIKDNISPEPVDTVLDLFFTQQIAVEGEITLTKKVHSGTSFVLDHPVYGELDSPILELDGGYDESQTEVIISQSF